MPTALAAAAVLLAGAVVTVAVGRAVVAGWREDERREDERRARLELQFRPVGWVSAGDRASHSGSVISRAEFQTEVLGKSPAEVWWARFPNGPMPPDIDAAESLLVIGETAHPTSGCPEGEIEVLFAGGRAVRVVLP